MATSRRRSLFVILMLVALVAGLISPVTADEPRLEQRPVAKRAEHTGAAWTAARMRNARPRDIVLPAEAHERGGPSVAQTSRPGRRGPSEPTAIRIHSSSMLESDLVTTGPPAEVTTDYKTFPLSTHGKVFFSDGAGDYVCSATAIDSANLSVVWTAGHCVHEGGFTGDWYVDWEFVPAYKDGATPLGTWEAERMWSPPQWVNNQDIRYDYAVVVVEPSAAGNKLTEVTGGRGIKWSQVREQDFQAFGYPAAPPFDGEWMFTCNSPYLGADADHPGPGPATMAID